MAAQRGGSSYGAESLLHYGLGQGFLLSAQPVYSSCVGGSEDSPFVLPEI